MIDVIKNGVPVKNLSQCDSAVTAVDQLTKLYNAAIEQITNRFNEFTSNSDIGAPDEAATYPYICMEIPPAHVMQTSNLALGRIASTNIFGATITNPSLFAEYLTDQISKIESQYQAKIYVGASTTPIPLTFALEQASGALSIAQRRQLQIHFHTPNLVDTNDDIVDGKTILKRDGPMPLSLFSAPRTDYSLHRIRHYTATSPEHFQQYILFTNYQRYVDEFLEYANAKVHSDHALELVEPGDRITRKGMDPSAGPIKKLPQMPAYHLVQENKSGVTLVNIGVGPSNAKNITDHLAVLRPHVWLMIGHCGALRRSQRLGDYILAHAYLREDSVLDDVLPPSVPLPTLAEVQLALTQAVKDESNITDADLKKHLRTGTVITTDDRNWELRFDEIAVRLNQARAIAIDMESATVAANGYRYRVPYGTLLCASDRPLHGEVKLPGMADAFYQERVSQHLAIGLRAIDLMREEAEVGVLHSRKLRSFDEPLFR